MSAQQVRNYYGVPAKQGMRVKVDGRAGTLAGFTRSGLYIRVRFDGDKRSTAAHPTWRVDYGDGKSYEREIHGTKVVTVPVPGVSA
jgi:hypothetical protein